MAKLTEAGFRMIGKFIEHERFVREHPCHAQWYTGKDGRIFMTLSPGDGAAAMTVRKLVRDGFAEGSFNWGSRSRWIIPTQAGLDAYWSGATQREHEAESRRAFG